MVKKSHPHDDVVEELRHLLVSLNTRQRLSDDMDMYYVRVAGYSPMLEAGKEQGRKLDQAEVLSRRLLDAGTEAAEAVAKGLRMQGRWREKLLPYAMDHRSVTVIRESLGLVAKRQLDPLASRAAKILAVVDEERAGR